MKILFETERLIIKDWETQDYKDLYDYARNPEVSKFLSYEPYSSLQVAKNSIKIFKEKQTKGSMLRDYAIYLKNENKVIGSIGVTSFSERAEGIIEIGYTLNPAFQHNGYMTEALKGYFQYIKSNDIAKRIVCKCDTLNTASINVAKRAGMTFEGIARKAGNKNHLHSRYDLAVYSILYEEIK